MVYSLNGRKVDRQEFLKHSAGLKGILKARKFNTISTGWPLHSDALGVNPDQRQEAYEESVRMGVPTHFDEEGCAILISRQHKRRYCEANGMFDRDAGYGDAAPKNVTSVRKRKQRRMK